MEQLAVLVRQVGGRPLQRHGGAGLLPIHHLAAVMMCILLTHRLITLPNQVPVLLSVS